MRAATLIGRARAHSVARTLGVRDDERGVGMIMAVGVSAVVFLLTVMWTGIANHQVTASGRERSSEQATHAAEAAVHEAMSVLSADPDRALPFTSTLTTLDQHGDVFGEYQYTVGNTGNNVSDPVRVIDATGWAPEKSNPRAAAKRVEVTVRLTSGTPFQHVLFAGNGDLTLGTTATVTGDMYASETVTWGASANIEGDVDAWSGIRGRGSVTGNLHAAGNADCGTPCGVKYETGVVTGNVRSAEDSSQAGGQVRLVACGGCEDPAVNGDVEAAKTVIPNPADVSGQIIEGQQPDLPTRWYMPSFTWNAANYNPSNPVVDTTVSGFDTTFDNAQRTAGSLKGAYNVQGSSGTIKLGGTYCATAGTCPPLVELPVLSWSMNDDLTIYTNRPVELSTDVINASLPAKNLKLVIVTTYGSPTTDAVTFAKDVSPPSSIEVLVVALNGRVRDTDTAAQSLPRGTIYGAVVELGNGWTISEGDFSSVPGFTWANPEHAPVEIVSYHDLPA